MKTPAEYTISIKSKVITSEILSGVLYSINKRAKNCRDKKREYYDKATSVRSMAGPYVASRYFDSVTQYKENELDYYSKKDYLLKQLTSPIRIHFEIFVHENWDYYPESDEEHEEDEFIGVRRYYLYFEVGNRTFHIPIEKTDLKKYKNLDVVELTDGLITEGKDINELLSNQFINKFIELVKSKKFTYNRN